MWFLIPVVANTVHTITENICFLAINIMTIERSLVVTVLAYRSVIYLHFECYILASARGGGGEGFYIAQCRQLIHGCCMYVDYVLYWSNHGSEHCSEQPMCLVAEHLVPVVHPGTLLQWHIIMVVSSLVAILQNLI